MDEPLSHHNREHSAGEVACSAQQPRRVTRTTPREHLVPAGSKARRRTVVQGLGQWLQAAEFSRHADASRGRTHGGSISLPLAFVTGNGHLLTSHHSLVLHGLPLVGDVLQSAIKVSRALGGPRHDRSCTGAGGWEIAPHRRAAGSSKRWAEQQTAYPIARKARARGAPEQVNSELNSS